MMPSARHRPRLPPPPALADAFTPLQTPLLYVDGHNSYALQGCTVHVSSSNARSGLDAARKDVVMIRVADGCPKIERDAQGASSLEATASGTAERPRMSIIIPVYNNPRDLRECLLALLSSSCPGTEIIVVDDASTDDTPALAVQMGVRVIRLAKNSGPAAARNHGARQAQGEILFFVDADVLVASDGVSRVLRVFEEDGGVAAVFGSYDALPRARGVVSQYRNLLHHFVHQHGNPEASTFWAGCGAIRRSVFNALGGFDAASFPAPSVEDIELGYRLRRAGHHIRLDKALQATHLKRWTLWSVIQTDICRRAIPWARLILARKHAPDDLNLKRGQRLSAVLVLLACLLMPIGVFGVIPLAVAAAACLGVVILNRELYTFFYRKRGFAFALACVPLHFLYYLYSGLGYLYAWCGFQLGHLTSIWKRAI
jgi:GT2 family glycosyltransferase